MLKISNPQISNLRLSEIIDFKNWEELHEIRENLEKSTQKD